MKALFLLQAKITLCYFNSGLSLSYLSFLDNKIQLEGTYMQNCWEFKDCGREPGGHRSAERGICPAATFEVADGFLGGINGGRACSFISGTFCCEVVSGTIPDRSKNCAACAFYDDLRYKRGKDFSVSSFLSYVESKKGDTNTRRGMQNG